MFRKLQNICQAFSSARADWRTSLSSIHRSKPTSVKPKPDCLKLVDCWLQFVAKMVGRLVWHWTHIFFSLSCIMPAGTLTIVWIISNYRKSIISKVKSSSVLGPCEFSLSHMQRKDFALKQKAPRAHRSLKLLNWSLKWFVNAFKCWQQLVDVWFVLRFLALNELLILVCCTCKAKKTPPTWARF